MVSKRWMFGALLAVALVAPISTTSFANSGWSFTAPEENSGDVPLDVIVAQGVTDHADVPSSSQAAPGSSDQLALSTTHPDPLPVRKRVAHVVPVANVEQVASPTTVFRSNRFWVIGSYR